MKHNGNAFTLIELLVVLAILGILATMVLVLINPREQMSRANDAARISSVNQLGHQVQAYFTTKEGLYPDPVTWDQDLVSTNDLGSFPSGVEYFASNGITNCTTNERPTGKPNYCYSYDPVSDSYGAIIFTKLEAQNQRSKCSVTGELPYFVYSTSDGRGGILCRSSDPSPWEAGTVNYLP
jgi:prepilin-type N-terminal cleavage/methylation domain-containing protein